MTAAKKIPNADDREHAQSLFLGPPAKPLAPTTVHVPPKRDRWLPPKRNASGGWDVRSTSGETRSFPTQREADDFFEEKAGLGR